MDLKGILSISGYPGLYKHISEARNGIIVESLETKKRMPAYATYKISALDDIAIFTQGAEDVHLKDVFRKMYQKQDGKEAISHKSKPEELKAYFAQVLPEYDRDRVYVSDIKRVVNWYNILVKHDMIDLEADQQEEETAEENEKPEETQESENQETETQKENDTTPEEK